ncbi:MAG: hypothetical protein WKF47_06510 [Geodermatophilaceae bacterium]
MTVRRITALFDIGYLRHVPNIVHMQPKDEDEFVDMLWTMANYNVRSDRNPLSARRRHGRAAKGDTEVARDRQGRSRASTGRDVAIFGLGNMFEIGVEAARLLEAQGVSGCVDQPSLDQAARHRHA